MKRQTGCLNAEPVMFQRAALRNVRAGFESATDFRLAAPVVISPLPMVDYKAIDKVWGLLDGRVVFFGVVMTYTSRSDRVAFPPTRPFTIGSGPGVY